MASSIPFDEQFFVEKDRNNKYEWLIFCITIILLLFHGILFHWLPRYFRGKREIDRLRYLPYFKFVNKWDIFTSCVAVKLPYRKQPFYFQPSVLLLGLAFLAVSGVFCFVETTDLDYQPRYYVVSKRISKVSVGTLPTLMIMLMKNDLVTSITGLQHDRVTFLHIWLGRLMWISISVHLALACKYWLGLNFEIMIMIPPQIFGMMAYGCLFFLTWASMKFIRTWSYDFFLFQHRVFAFIMLLMSFFHNKGNRAAVLISVHGLVIDRVVSRAISVVHKRRCPTKGESEFEILDDETILVTIPVKEATFSQKSWYTVFLPNVKIWKPGQHIFLNVPKINFFQMHPFTIASLQESGDMKLLIRTQKGFTKRLMKKLVSLNETNDDEATEIMTTASSQTGRRHKLKVNFHGPYGAKHQPLINFDSILFFAAGSGGAFVFPVAVALLREIKRKEENNDYLHRPKNNIIRIVWSIKKKENMIWFADSFGDLEEFLEERRLIISIYITQESKSNDVVPNYEINTVNSKFTEKQLTQFTFETVKATTSSSNNSFAFSESDLMSYNYGRPDVAEIIGTSASAIEEYNSLAVCSCGPPPFVNNIKVACNSNRKKKHAPDIYCYSESF